MCPRAEISFKGRSEDYSLRFLLDHTIVDGKNPKKAGLPEDSGEGKG
jgi:hypothetical protein